MLKGCLIRFDTLRILENVAFSWRNHRHSKEENQRFFFFISDLRTAFDLLDRNQDGHVTTNELQFMLRNLGINVRDELIDDLIKEASHTGE